MLEKGTIGIPNSYFLKMAKHDYESYDTALAREFYQNSIDAKASNITVGINLSSKCITVEDDGSGMTLDILKHKLLVLGGSHKESGSVGAFGKAKELLFFSWVKYTIRTGNLLVEGKGAEYEIKQVESLVKGTTCTIWMPIEDSMSMWISHFKTVASRMQTRTKITVNSDLIKCERKRGKAVRKIEGVGIIHQVKVRDRIYMQVRINGIWMFNQYVGDNMGELILELDGQSVDVLTSNRDGFKWDVRNKVSLLLEELTTNRAAALDVIKPQTKVNIPGNGVITVGEEQLAIAKTKIANGNNLMAVVDQVFKTNEELTAINQFRVANAAKITNVEWDDFKDHIEFIGYEPDFTLLHDEGEGNKTKKFMSTKKARLLAIMWTEIVKQVLMDNKRYLRFTAGFTFNKNVEAEIEQGAGDTIVYLNPTSIKTSEHRRVIMEDLKDLAIHELAHLRISNHNNDFVNEMAEIRKNVTRADQKSYSGIQRTRA